MDQRSSQIRKQFQSTAASSQGNGDDTDEKDAVEIKDSKDEDDDEDAEEDDTQIALIRGYKKT